MKIRKIVLKKRWIVLAVMVLVVSAAALLCHMDTLSGITFELDTETGEVWTDASETSVPEYVSLHLEKERVSIREGEVIVHLAYNGDKPVEFYGLPVLEMRRGDTWYWVKRKPFNQTLEQRFIQPGISGSTSVNFEDFGRFLPPGEYRLLYFFGGDQAAVEFEVGWW